MVAPARAQAAPASADEPPPRLEASAQFTFLSATGNASTQSLGAGGDLTWRPSPWTHTARAIFAQSETDDVLGARSFTALYRASRSISPRLSAYGQYDFLRDVFAGVEQRHVTEGGLAWLVTDRAPHRLWVDSAIGYLYENRPAGEHFESATLSLGARYRLAISGNSEFTYDPRVLLTLADVGAWKYDQLANLSVALNSVLSLKLSHTIRYSAQPAPGFDTTDTITAVSIVAKIRRTE